MNRNRIIDLWVGLFAVLGIAAVLFLAFKAANATAFRADQTYHIKAKFDNIGGLRVRAPVKSAGVVVGRVLDIELDRKEFDAVVTLAISSKYEFPKDTSAKILTSGLLGEQFIGLSAGGDTANLQDGDVLKITQSAVLLENLISQFLFNRAAEGTPEKK